MIVTLYHEKVKSTALRCDTRSLWFNAAMSLARLAVILQVALTFLAFVQSHSYSSFVLDLVFPTAHPAINAATGQLATDTTSSTTSTEIMTFSCV